MRKVFLAAPLLLLAACPPADETPDGGRDTTAAAAAPADPVQAKIAQAMSAGPPDLAAAATIMDWPDSTGHSAELRAGSNGWVCMPSAPAPPGTEGENPMCLDAVWQAWAQAYLSRGPVPKATTVGFGYMLAGDRGASNVDPWATAPTADNQWVTEGPHLMLLLPTPSALDGLPTDPHNGGAYVMWKGTPYAHVMVPLR
jgi:hypothetical protein